MSTCIGTFFLTCVPAQENNHVYILKVARGRKGSYFTCERGKVVSDDIICTHNIIRNGTRGTGKGGSGEAGLLGISMQEARHMTVIIMLSAFCFFLALH